MLFEGDIVQSDYPGCSLYVKSNGAGKGISGENWYKSLSLPISWETQYIREPVRLLLISMGFCTV